MDRSRQPRSNAGSAPPRQGREIERVELNRAVAHGYAHGPAAGLAVLAKARAGGALDDYPLAVAAEADLTARRGDRDRAAALFQQAAAVVHSEPERRALLDRADELFA